MNAITKSKMNLGLTTTQAIINNATSQLSPSEQLIEMEVRVHVNGHLFRTQIKPELAIA